MAGLWLPLLQTQIKMREWTDDNRKKSLLMISNERPMIHEENIKDFMFNMYEM